MTSKSCIDTPIDDFLVGYCQQINKSYFVVKVEAVNRRRKGKREVLNKSETSEILAELNKYIEKPGGGQEDQKR